MKRSTWIIVVGVLATVIGLNGVLQGLISLASTVHQVMEQPEMVSEGAFDDGVPSNEESSAPGKEQPTHERSQQYDPPFSDQAFEILGRLLADNNSWAVVRTVVYLLIAGAYVVAGIVLIFKPSGPRIFFLVIAASIFWSLMQILFYSQAEMEMLLTAAMIFGPSVVIDVILGAIVWAVTRVQPLAETRNEDQVSLPAEGSRMALTMNVWIPKITGIFAALFALIFPFWILGVPGVENTYAQGWRMGLDVIMYYPIAWAIVFGVSWLLKKAIPLNRQTTLNGVVSLCLFIFFSMALVRLGQAFSLIAT